MNNKAIKTLAAVGLAAAGVLSAATPGFAAAATSGGFVQDFNFAASNTTGGVVVSTPGFIDSTNSWELVSGSIDVSSTSPDGAWNAPTGSIAGTRVLDLNGTTAGTIQQELTGLTAEKQYIVSFQVAANPTCGSGVLEGHATIGGVTVPTADGDGTFAHDTTGETPSTLAWQTKTFVFNTGVGETTALLGFVSDSTGNCGVMLTDISATVVGAAPLLDPLVVGSSLAAAGLVGFGVYTVRRRRTETA